MDTPQRMIQWLALLALIVLQTQLSTGFAQGTAFSYQGRLNDGGKPATGTYDLRFTIYDALTNGNAVSGVLTDAATPVSSGLFSVTLDFGAGVFTGPERWLEVGVRTNGGSVFTTLSPRQPLLPVPYTVMASSANTLLGTLPAAQLSGTIPAANLDGSKIQPGTVNSNALDAATAAQLARAGAGGTNTGVGSGGPFTNAAFFSSPGTQRTYMISNNVPIRGSGTSLWLWSPPSDYFGGIGWQGNTAGNEADIYYWPTHSAAGGELIIESSASLALLAKWVQHGLEAQPQYEYYQHFDIPKAANTNLFGSVPLEFAAFVYTNSSNKIYAGSLDPAGDWMPTLYFDATSTNGSGAWHFYGRGWTGTSPWVFNDEVMRVTVGPDQGVTINGNLTVNNTATVTTNVVIGGYRFIIKDGLICAPLAPYVFDADAADYLARIGGTSAEISNSFDTFCSTLKSDGTWTNFDALYPFAGASSGSNGQNIISSSYTISWHGSFSTMSSNGVQPAPSSGYGDTGWQPTNYSGNAGLFIYFSTNGNSGDAIGARYDSGSSGMFDAIVVGTAYGYRVNSSQTPQFLTIPPYFTGTGGLYVGRVSDTQRDAYWTAGASDGTVLNGSPGPTLIPPYNVFIGCINDGDGGGPYNYWNTAGGTGTLQFVGLGRGTLSYSQYQTLIGACKALNATLGR